MVWGIRKGNIIPVTWLKGQHGGGRNILDSLKKFCGILKKSIAITAQKLPQRNNTSSTLWTMHLPVIQNKFAPVTLNNKVFAVPSNLMIFLIFVKLSGIRRFLTSVHAPLGHMVKYKYNNNSASYALRYAKSRGDVRFFTVCSITALYANWTVISRQAL